MLRKKRELQELEKKERKIVENSRTTENDRWAVEEKTKQGL